MAPLNRTSRRSSRATQEPDRFAPPALVPQKSSMCALGDKLSASAKITKAPLRGSFAKKMAAFKKQAEAPSPVDGKGAVQRAKFGRKLDAFNHGHAPVAGSNGAASGSMRRKLAAFGEAGKPGGRGSIDGSA